MDNFRLILIGCGVVLLVAIYLWGVTVARRRSGVDETDDYHRDQQLGGELDPRRHERRFQAARNVGEGLQQQQAQNQQAKEEQAELSLQQHGTQHRVDEQDWDHRVPAAAGQGKQGGEGRDVGAQLNQDLG